jgi:hypothetical protein
MVATNRNPNLEITHIENTKCSGIKMAKGEKDL